MNIAVYCASSTQIDAKYSQLARALGQLLAQRGHTLINGAGNMGLMAACADACLANGGRAVGVIPQFMIDEGWQHRGMSELRITRTMAERKEQMAQMSEAAVVLPGGVGTLDELSELLCLKQLGLYSHPIVLVNLDGYYDPLLEQLRRVVNEHFMRPCYAGIYSVARDEEEAVRLCETEGEADLSDRRKCKF